MDINSILKDWPHEPSKVTARRIRGDDGRDKIQFRVALGLYQMEVTGRPDGQRPFGCNTLLDYYEQQVARHRQRTGSDEGFALDEGACERLRSEAEMFYNRYLAEFVLDDYVAVERDTQHNLRLMDLCSRYAKEDSDRFTLEQFRPYVLMMSARARALLALGQDRPKAALAAVREGIEGIKDFLRRFGPEQAAAQSGELAILRGVAKEIEGRIPEDPIAKLRKDLAKAVKEERYEDAASFRDQLRTIRRRTAPEEDGRP